MIRVRELKVKLRTVSLCFVSVLCLLMCAAPSISAPPGAHVVRSSDDGFPIYTNKTDIFASRSSAGREDELARILNDIGNEHDCHIGIYIDDSDLSEDAVQAAAEAHADKFGSDNVVLYIAMGSRYMYISTTGRLAEAVPNKDIDKILEAIAPFLSRGEFYDGLRMYALEVGDYLSVSEGKMTSKEHEKRRERRLGGLDPSGADAPLDGGRERQGTSSTIGSVEMTQPDTKPSVRGRSKRGALRLQTIFKSA